MKELNELFSKLIENYNKNSIKVNLNLYRAPIVIAGRHVHLAQNEVDILFGKGYKLNPIEGSTSDSLYICKECLTLAGPCGAIEKVMLVGPTRQATQVEILRMDATKLGIKPMIRLSGNLDGTPGITLIGPQGTAILKQGVIVSKRTLNLNLEEAKERNLHAGDVVSIRVNGERAAILENVVVRIKEGICLNCQLDQEEVDALGLSADDYVEIIR